MVAVIQTFLEHQGAKKTRNNTSHFGLLRDEFVARMLKEYGVKQPEFANRFLEPGAKFCISKDSVKTKWQSVKSKLPDGRVVFRS
jgi:hypothetical protein